MSLPAVRASTSPAASPGRRERRDRRAAPDRPLMALRAHGRVRSAATTHRTPTRHPYRTGQRRQTRSARYPFADYAAQAPRHGACGAAGGTEAAGKGRGPRRADRGMCPTSGRGPPNLRGVGRPKGRTRQERGLVDKTIAPEVERDAVLHAPDGCPDCHEPAPDHVYVSPEDRVIVRMQLHKGRLVDFALVQQHREGDDSIWRDVAEADCRHDKVHVHWYDARGKRSGETDIMPIVTQADVEAGMERASEMLFDQWEENLRRCMVDGR